MKTTIKVKLDQTKIPNKMHFDHLRKSKMSIFKDKTKYNRKVKHKGLEFKE